MVNVTIPESVTTIGIEAFFGCTSLANIVIPSNVTKIGQNAFHETAWYNEQPDGVIYIDKLAYSYKGTMPKNTSIEIENETTELLAGIFDGATNLIAITIPASLTKIGENAFNKCTGLKNVYISDLTAWCNILFENSASQPLTANTSVEFNLNKQKVTKLTIPDDVTEIASYAFNGATKFTSVTIPEGVTRISYNSFSGCTALTSVSIPTSVSILEEYTFSGCTKLTSINIPEGVTIISPACFSGCSTLATIHIPASIQYIGSNAFASCKGLEKNGKVYCHAEEVPETESDAFNTVDVKKAQLFVPTNSVEQYTSHPVWGLFKIEAETESEDIETGIRATGIDNQTIAEVYDINGRKQNTLQHGLNIIRMSDGTTRKVLMK